MIAKNASNNDNVHKINRLSSIRAPNRSGALKLGVYTGEDIDNLPKIQSSLVKIFLSSTFSDFKNERNYLYENVVPKVRNKLIADYGLDFILVEMRWGINEESSQQNIMKKLCLDEIERAKQESVAINFIGMLSHRYGARLLLDEIPQIEFELIKREISRLNTAADFELNNFITIPDLLDCFYESDLNELQNKKYKIQSNDKILKALNFKNKMKSSFDNTMLEKLKREVGEHMRNAANNLKLREIFNEAQKNKYFISVTESEMIEGIFKQDLNKTHFFFREISDLKPDTGSIWFEGNEKANNLLQNLKENINKRYINDTDKLIHLSTTMQDLTSKDGKYLKQFGRMFEKAIYESVKKFQTEQQTLNEGDIEILQHWYFYKKSLQKYQRRKEYAKEIDAYLNADDNRAYIIYGPSGIGKSSIMANIVEMARQKGMIIIQRYLGTSRQSSSAKAVLKSIIYQLSKIFKEFKAFPEQERKNPSIDKLKTHLITNLSKITSKQRLFFMFDALDQLNDDDHDLEFIFEQIPQNAKLFFSILTRNKHEKDFKVLNKLFETLKSKFSREPILMKVSGVQGEYALSQLQQWLSDKNRCLTELQFDALKDFLTILRKTSGAFPLHLELIFDIIVKWPSSFKKVDLLVNDCLSIDSTLSFLFKELQKIHGKMFLSHTVFYLTIFENGISEQEIEDILSIDDEVLLEIFEYQEPPVRRFPISLWLRLRKDLREYLTEKEANGTKVIAWFHKCFLDAAEAYYLEIFEELRKEKSIEAYKDELLMNVIDYFTEKWNKEPKKFMHSKEMQKKLNVNGSACVRNTRTQKMIFLHKDGLIKSFNERKLAEFVRITRMLTSSQMQIDLLLEHFYFSYEFMLALILKFSYIFIDLNDHIKNNLVIKEETPKTRLLKGISALYANKFKQFQAYPESISEVFSRLSKEEKLAQKFEAEFKQFERKTQQKCSLLPFYNTLPLNDSKKIVYTCDYGVVSSLWISHSSPHVLIANLIDHVNRNADDCSSDINCFKLYKLIIVNYETFQSIEGEIEIKSDEDVDPRPFFNVNPKKNYARITQFDGGILYCNKSLFKKSFKKDEEILIKDYEESVEQFFFINLDRVLVSLSDHFEILNFNSGETLALVDKPDCIFFASNKRIHELIYSPDFDQIPTFLFFFNANKDQKDIKDIWPIKIYENSFMYKISCDYYDDYVAERKFSIENAAINNEFSRVKGDSREKEIFKFTYFDKNLHVCTINKADFKIEQMKHAQFTEKTNASAFRIIDFYMDRILVRDSIENELLCFETGNDNVCRMGKLESGFYTENFLNEKGKWLSIKTKDTVDQCSLKINVELFLKDNHFYEVTNSRVAKVDDSNGLESNKTKTQRMLMRSFMSETYFIACLRENGKEKYVLINVLDDKITLTLGYEPIGFLSMYYVLCDRSLYFINEKNDSKELIVIKKEFEIEAKFYIEDNASKVLFYAHSNGVEYNNDDRKHILHIKASIKIRKIRIDEQSQQFIEDDLGAIEINSSSFPSSYFDYVILNEKYLLILTDEYLHCYDILNRNSTTKIASYDLFNCDNWTQFGRQIHFETFGKHNKFLCFHESLSFQYKNLIEVTPQLKVNKKIESSFIYWKREQYLCFRSNGLTIVFDIANEVELWRLDSLLNNRVLISPNLKYLVIVNLSELRIYYLREKELLVKLNIEAGSDVPLVIMNHKYMLVDARLVEKFFIEEY